MALTVETGMGSPSADSLVTLAQVRAHAVSRGYTLSAVDSELECLVRRAHDYLTHVEDRFQGERTSSDQSLPFPRCGVILHGTPVEDDEIPSPLVLGLCQLVCEMNVVDPLPSTVEFAVREETVGPISTKYATSFGATTAPTFPAVFAHWSPLLIAGNLTRVHRV